METDHNVKKKKKIKKLSILKLGKSCKFTAVTEKTAACIGPDLLCTCNAITSLV